MPRPDTVDGETHVSEGEHCLGGALPDLVEALCQMSEPHREFVGIDAGFARYKREPREFLDSHAEGLGHVVRFEAGFGGRLGQLEETARDATQLEGEPEERGLDGFNRRVEMVHLFLVELKAQIY